MKKSSIIGGFAAILFCIMLASIIIGCEKPLIFTVPVTSVEIYHDDNNVTSVILRTIDDPEKDFPNYIDLTALVLPFNASNKTVIWASDDEQDEFVTLNNGKITAVAPTEESQPVTITVTTVDGGYFAICTITVLAPGKNPVPVESVTILRNGEPVTTVLPLIINTTVQLSANVLPENASNKTVNWVSSDPAVASIVSGFVTAQGIGITLITATAGTVNSTPVEIRVDPAPMLAYTLDFSNATSGLSNQTGNLASIAGVVRTIHPEAEHQNFTMNASGNFRTSTTGGVQSIDPNGAGRMIQSNVELTGPIRVVITARNMVNNYWGSATIGLGTTSLTQDVSNSNSVWATSVFEFPEDNSGNLSWYWSWNPEPPSGDGNRLSLRKIEIYEYVIYDPMKGIPRVNITAQPADINVLHDFINDSTRLTVAAEYLDVESVPLPLIYQWYTAAAADGSGASLIAGAESASYVVPSNTGVGTYHYFVKVSSSNSDIHPATSRTAMVNVTSQTNVWNNTYTPAVWPQGRNFSRTSIMVNNPQMWRNDTLVPVAAPGVLPVMENNVLMLPVAAAQTVFTNVTWNVNGNTITAVTGGRTATLTIGSTNMPVTGSSTVQLAVAPRNSNGVIYLPVIPIISALNPATTSISWHGGDSILVVITGENVGTGEVTWGNLRSQNARWYGGERSMHYANNLMVMQRNNGGWPRGTGQGAANVGTAGSDHYPSQLNLSQASINYHLGKKNEIDSYFGRGITTFDIRYMMMMYEATKIPSYRDSYMRGLRAILNAQYPCGGWPYYVTDKTLYRGAITFSDEATTRLMELLTDILNGNFRSVTNSTASDAINLSTLQGSYNKGLQSILDLQVWSEEQQMLTAWAQAYSVPGHTDHWAQDFLNFPGSTRSNKQPTWQREFEPPAIGGDESTRLILFLMSIPNPSPDVQKAVHAAIAFFEYAAIRGFRRNTNGPMEFGAGNGNRVLVNDSSGVVWPRFIDINTFQPLFSDRRSPTLRTDVNAQGMTEVQAHGSRPGIMFNSPGGQLRNIYVNSGNSADRRAATLTNGAAVVHPAAYELDLITSYANLSFERRSGYHFMGTWPQDRILGAPYNNWLTRNGLTKP
ncbi:MAG: Ig-like domain-containing protein [Treponema sp.]|nr:Ig-like domain-containing protein [Treponema sp.]